MNKVCVIGAGASGITMGRLLKARGYEVTILESTARVGGMCCSIAYTEPGANEPRYFDVGANYVTKDYTEVRALADELGFDLVTDTAFQNQHALNVYTGEIRPGTAVVNEKIPRLKFGAAAIRYLYLQWKYRKAVQTPGFGQVSAEPGLNHDFATWLRLHNLMPLYRLFMIPITAFGYGPLEQVPAAHAMKYIDTGRFLSMLATGLHLPQSWPRRVKRGFGTLLQAAARDLHIELETTVLKVTRAPGQVTITSAKSGEAPLDRTFDTLVVAMPPDAATFLDMTNDEQRLFRKGVIKYRDFRITTAVVPGFPYQVMIELMAQPHMGGAYPPFDPTDGPPGNGHPWIFGKQWDDSKLLLFYANVPSDTDQERVVAMAKQDCEMCCAAGGSGHWLQQHSCNQWPQYFPHVEVGDMINFDGTGESWYDLVEALQGTNETYYVHGVVAFELVESIMEYARNLVEARFPRVSR